MKEIYCFEDFCDALLECGFSEGGGSGGVFSVVPFGWDEEPPYDTPVRWHTGDPQTDPWEWRIRVLDERNDIAYAKFFGGKSGYITAAWFPCFLAARREGRSFDEAYSDGLMSATAKSIYGLIRENEVLPYHEIKRLGGFGKEDKSRFERAIVELQTKLFITICGREQKLNKYGESFGWSSTSFCTTESFWGADIFAAAGGIDRDEAVSRITERAYELNPDADPKKVKKLIGIK